MRKVGLGLLLLALAVGLGLPADAGPTAGKLVGLYLAYYPNPEGGGGNSQIIKPRVEVGSVVFRPYEGDMNVDITLNSGKPDETFQVFFVPLASWGSVVDQGFTLATDGDGYAKGSFTRPIPDDAKGNADIKAIVRVSRYGPVYATERVKISLKKGK